MEQAGNPSFRTTRPVAGVPRWLRLLVPVVKRFRATQCTQEAQCALAAGTVRTRVPGSALILGLPLHSPYIFAQSDGKLIGEAPKEVVRIVPHRLRPK